MAKILESVLSKAERLVRPAANGSVLFTTLKRKWSDLHDSTPECLLLPPYVQKILYDTMLQSRGFCRTVEEFERT
jgi:hypothetical protein